MECKYYINEQMQKRKKIKQKNHQNTCNCKIMQWKVVICKWANETKYTKVKQNINKTIEDWHS